jgi:thioredoxin reductase
MEVKKYLNDYCQKFGLEQHIHYGCNVEQLTVTEHEDNDEWPLLELQWKCDGETYQQTFDNVLICNGHYTLPSYPNLQGIDAFKGRVIHAIEYDNPDEFKGKTVLCVGARASGADIAREIGQVAKKVYLSDSTSAEKKEFDTNVVLMPRTRHVDEEGVVHFSSSQTNQEQEVGDIDVIIFCSGYDYCFPFINKGSNLELQCVPGERSFSSLRATLACKLSIDFFHWASSLSSAFSVV